MTSKDETKKAEKTPVTKTAKKAVVQGVTLVKYLRGLGLSDFVYRYYKNFAMTQGIANKVLTKSDWKKQLGIN